MSSLSAACADGYCIPPEYDGRTQKVGISKFNANSKGSSAFERHGTVRFELPFDSWCLKCKVHMNRGLRFNATKEKDGNYFTTTIFKFSMNCVACKEVFEIRTDPANSDYEYVSGLKKQEFENEQEKKETKKKQAAAIEDISLRPKDPMEKMERSNEQIRVVDLEAERMTNLMEVCMY